MKRSWTISRWTVIGMFIFFLTVACGQKKIAGPFPETGDVTLRVLVLADPRLPSLPDADLRKVLDSAEKQIESRTAPSRRVHFEIVRRGDLQDEFDRLTKPFGKLSFPYRLDPASPLTDDAKRVLYARLSELLRTDKLRPMLPLFSLDANFANFPVLLNTATEHLDRGIGNLRSARDLFSPAFQTDGVRDRRSISAWYTVLGAIPSDSKPADLILSNDLLIFDALYTLPPACLATGGVTPGYTRLYPGIALVSTLPFLSDDTVFSIPRGDSSGDKRREMLAWAISQEVGGKMLMMRENEFSHSGCLNRIWIPPFSQALDPSEKSGPCAERHAPLERRQLLTAYLSDFVRISIVSKQFDQAEHALERLAQLTPDDPVVSDLRSALSAARARTAQ